MLFFDRRLQKTQMSDLPKHGYEHIMARQFSMLMGKLTNNRLRERGYIMFDYNKLYK